MWNIAKTWQKKNWINEINFFSILGTGWVEDRKMMKGKLIDGKKF